jgi:hypothetical protein
MNIRERLLKNGLDAKAASGFSFYERMGPAASDGTGFCAPHH